MSHLNSLTDDIEVDKISSAINLLKEYVTENENQSNKKIDFLIEQLKLNKLSVPRYSPEMLIWAAKFYFSFPSAYRLVRNSERLILPHPIYLKSLLQNLGSLESGKKSIQTNYLTKKCIELTENEKLVNLTMDEIYIKPQVVYKGGKVEGYAINENNIEATTLQCFMISSVFSKNKDVVGLFPMKNQTAADLLPILENVLEALQLAGYTVLTIISDNNRINRKAFEKMCGGVLSPSIENPYHPGKQIFILFDNVHLMKSIRNNWLNNIDTNQTFYIPVMKFLPSSHAINKTPAYASILHLKRLYNNENECSVKLAPSLSRKSLFPNHLERQDVQTALNLFDDKLIPALQISKPNIGDDVVGTIHFIDIFSKWWKIINVKTPEKGKHKRDLYCDPITSTTCHNINFLKDFCNWLEEWENQSRPYFAKPNSRSGKLSKETNFSLLHTTQTLILLIEYLFKTYKPCYLLLGKFQTDCIEARFGQYRCMSGGNYHISVSQVLESERKLKLLSLMTLKSAKMGMFHIKSFLESVKDIDEATVTQATSAEFFIDVLFLSEMVQISEDNMKVLMYLGGYVAKKAYDGCIVCKEKLTINKELFFQADENVKGYLSSLDRGGLLWPSDFTLNVCLTVFKIFQTCISANYEEDFLKVSNQRDLLIELTNEKLQDEIDFERVCICNKASNTLNRCIKTMCNILLNNYIKFKNDRKAIKKDNTRKLATVKK